MSVEFKPKRRADKDVVSYFEFSGLRNDIPTHRFDATDLAIADNVVIDKSHRIFRRRGATKRVPGAAHSLWSSEDRAFYVAGTSLMELKNDMTTAALATNLSGARTSFCQPSDTLYFTDGATTKAMPGAGTALRTWGMQQPPLPLATVVAGDLDPGRYGITATYIRNDGQESGALAGEFFDVSAGHSLMLTPIASLDPGVVATRVYVTAVNGEVFMCVSENASASFTLTRAMIDAMVEPLATQFLGPPPPGQMIAYYKGHMFVAAGDVLYPSEPYSYELFDLRKFIQLDGEITLLAPLEDRSGGDSTGFFVGTSASCGILAGGGPDVFQYIPKADFGAVAGAATFVDGNLYADGAIGSRMLPMWLSTRGICVGMPGLEVLNLTRSGYGFPVGARGAALFVPEENRFIAVSDGGPGITMNAEVQALTTFSGFNYNSMTRFDTRSFGANANGVFELTGDTDDGAQIDAQVSFGVTDFGSNFMKGLDRMYVGLRSATPMNVEVKLEDKTAYQYVLDAHPDERMDSQRVKTGKGLEGRYWQFTLRNTLGGDFQLDVVDVQSKKMTRRLNGRA